MCSVVEKCFVKTHLVEQVLDEPKGAFFFFVAISFLIKPTCEVARA